MKHYRQSGFSLVELMVAVLLASITAVVVLNVLSNYQRRSANLIGRNDAQISASVALYSLEKEMRMAGAGLTLPGGELCSVGVNIAYDGAVQSNAAPLMPVRIIDGAGGAPDSIEIIRSDSAHGAAPTRLVAAMVAPTSQLSVDGQAGATAGDLVMVGASQGNKVCTLMELTAVTPNGSGWLLSHASGTGTGLYNPSDPALTFTNPQSYAVGDMVVNMGRYGVRRYGVLCTNGGAPTASNNCDLAWYNPLALTGPALTDANVFSITPQVIELQAQYGIAPAGSQQVNAWVDATGADWANPSAANLARIKAVRIAIVARGERDMNEVSPTAINLWDEPCNGGATCARALSSEERHYRYQVLTVVVPLINTIWARI